MIYEERLTQTEDDDNGEINEIKRVYKKEIDQLNETIITIKEDIESIKRNEKREKEEGEMYRKIKERAKLKEQHRKQQIKEKDIEI